MAVADALVSKVVDMLAAAAVEEIRLLAGVEEELGKLTSSLQSIRAVLVDAERRQLKEAAVQLWLDRLKSVAYDIDDVVDEWSYEAQKPQTERQKNANESTSKVWRFNIVSACYCFPKAVLRHQVAVKIGGLNARLDMVAMEKNRYNFQQLGGNVEPVERYITTSHINKSEVKGRDVDKEKLVNMLLSESSETSNLRLIPMLGMGGVGKTTLARLVYNDERVMSHFEKRRIWVCVSDPFDETRIAKGILETLLGTKPKLDSLPNIMDNIRESLEVGEEYLLVLDDVWNEDNRKWKQLEDCIRGSSSKITILVTTRKENVGRIMGCLESDLFPIGLLSEEESWELFFAIALSERSPEERVGLEEMGREVVRRCERLPLAIKAIASVLRFKKRRTEWQSVVDNELWNREEVKSEISGPLQLSFYDLPSHLKQCFLYCSVFPKDYEMQKSELVRHWMAHGYVHARESEDLETIGDEYFEILAMRSLFQDVVVENDAFGVSNTKCKMHDIVHDFARLLARKEFLSVEVSHDGDGISLDDSLGDSLRHLSIRFTDETRCPNSVYNLKRLRSLIMEPSVPDLQKIFNEFTVLRSLILSDCGIEEVPSSIKRLIHLRELDLSKNEDLEELPDTIWELYNLQILNLGNTGIKYVNGLGKLASLRCLENSITEFVLPKELVRLTSLRRLNWVNIDTDNKEAFSLKHLENFNHLSGSLMLIWLKRGNGDVEDAKQACLKDKKHITHLHLYFSWGDEDTENIKQQDEELAKALNAPPNLEFITIACYMALRTPTWLDSLTFVKMVHLIGWKNIENLPNNLGKLLCLEELGFYDFDGVTTVGAEFLGMNKTVALPSMLSPLFPKLKTLCFKNFDNWKKWNDVDVNGDEEMLIMPSLTCLKIYACQKLKALPKFILRKTSLELDIKASDALQLSLKLPPFQDWEELYWKAKQIQHGDGQLVLTEEAKAKLSEIERIRFDVASSSDSE